jgi:mono/diheme cytochrome c family protein
VEQPELKDEIDFHDLLRKPQRLFAYSYFYFLAVMLTLGILYLWNINAVGRNAITPVALSDSSAFAQDIPLEDPSVIPPVDVLKAGVASDSMIARGRTLFSRNCVSCHGEEGRGDGPTAATLNPKPRNFHSLAGWMNGSKVSQIYRTLQEGIVRTGMASFAYLPPADRFALAHYIRTLAPDQPVDTREDLLGLESAYGLSKGINSPGQIPIVRATARVLSEEAPEVRRAEQLTREIRHAGDADARFLRSNAGDLRRVIASLAARPSGLPAFDEFVRQVAADPAETGFLPAVTRLDRRSWLQLYTYLTKLSARLGGRP